MKNGNPIAAIVAAKDQSVIPKNLRVRIVTSPLQHPKQAVTNMIIRKIAGLRLYELKKKTNAFRQR